MNDIEIAAQQLASQIGIGMVGIEQIDPVAQSVTLLGQNRDARLALFKLLLVFTPRKQAAGASDREPAEQQQDAERKTLRQPLAGQFYTVSLAPHHSP